MIKLDLTPDTCSVIVWCSAEEAEELGGSIAGTMFESCDGEFYAMIGTGWDDDLSESENDNYDNFVQAEVIAEIESAGLRWEEI